MQKLKKWIESNLITSRKRINTRKFKKLIELEECQKIIIETSFLELSCKPSERIYCVLNDITAYPRCKTCRNVIHSFIDSSKGYRTYCSVRCMNSDPDISEKFKKTCMEKYGVSHPCKSKEVIKKREEKYMKKYGVSHHMKSEIVIENLKKTFMKKYGVDNPWKNKEVRKKIKETNISKYGSEYPMRNEEIKNKFEQSMLDKYGVKHALELDVFKRKSENTCLENYGVKSPMLSDEIKNRHKNNCMKKYGVENTSQIHIDKKVFSLLNDYDWLYDQHYKENQSCTDIAKTLNTSSSFVYKYFIKHNIKIRNLPKSRYEKEIIEFINLENIQANTRKIISPYELDIYMPDEKLAIEFDGIYWHSKKPKNYHLMKTEMCAKNNIQLLHIFESEWIDPIKQDIWKSIINSKLGRNNRIYGRKTEIREIKNNKLIKEFLDNSHLQGYCPSSIKIGLFYANELVSLMTFGKTRFSKKYQYEMTRFCNKKFTTIVGGASKLYKYFIDNYKPESVITYADRRYSNGDLYKKLGFEFSHFSAPNYWYFKNNENVLYSRIRFQKHKLFKLLETFDERKSEVENMLNNNYLRIFDCGNIIYKKM